MVDPSQMGGAPPGAGGGAPGGMPGGAPGGGPDPSALLALSALARRKRHPGKSKGKHKGKKK